MEEVNVTDETMETTPTLYNATDVQAATKADEELKEQDKEGEGEAEQKEEQKEQEEQEGKEHEGNDEGAKKRPSSVHHIVPPPNPVKDERHHGNHGNQQQQQPQQQNENSFNPSKTFSNVLESTKHLSIGLKKNLEPVAKELGRGFRQAVQFAGEKIGAVEMTPLPQEYLDLEARVDRLKTVYENLIRLAAHQINPTPGTEVKFTVYSTLNNVVDQLGTDSSLNPQDKLKGLSLLSPTPAQQLAGSFSGAAASLSPEDGALASALKKSADAQNKLGIAHQEMNQQIFSSFISPLSSSLETSFRNVYAARRLVFSSRVRLDAIKSQAKSASPVEVEALSEELQVAQTEFNNQVNLATEYMVQLLHSPQALECINLWMKSMLNFFKEGFAILSDLTPELDSINATFESNKRGSVESV